ncbi:MAG: penicillin-binding protein 2 [Robiginitomaculum sp.]|nr:penicillin-binding protein 2 [Robiginitomaculum sp.]
MIGKNGDRLTPLADTQRINLSRLFVPKGNHAEPVQTARPRIAALGLVLAAAAVVLTARAADLTIFNPSSSVTANNRELVVAQPRAQIIDRNGVLLAGNIETWDVYVKRADIDNVERLATRLATLDGVPAREVLRQRLTGKTGRVRIARAVTPKLRRVIFDLSEPGIEFERRLSRYYPNQALASHLLGWVDADGMGAQGAERAFDARLRDDATPLQLALDSRVQFTLEDEIQKAVQVHKPLAILGIITDVTTGEVLAMASWPSFDLNHFNTTKPSHRRNRAVTDPYELGSVFKPLTLAIALETGMKMNEVEFNVQEKLVIAGRNIRDFHPGPSPMTAMDILVHSSNKGAAKMALLAGGKNQREYLARFGLLDRARIELRESAPAYMASQSWSPIKTATIGYGHGLAVTAVSFVSALGGVVNDGQQNPLTLLPQTPSDMLPIRVVSSETSRHVRAAMRKVVTDGSGRRADVPGYGVAGKTGSAEKWDSQSSSYAKDRNVSSFVAIFPWEAPKYMVFVLLDEPQGGTSTFGWETAGWNAAPAVHNIISRIGPILNAPFSPPGQQAKAELAAAREEP